MFAQEVNPLIQFVKETVVPITTGYFQLAQTKAVAKAYADAAKARGASDMLPGGIQPGGFIPSYDYVSTPPSGFRLPIKKTEEFPWTTVLLIGGIGLVAVLLLTGDRK